MNKSGIIPYSEYLTEQKRKAEIEAEKEAEKKTLELTRKQEEEKRITDLVFLNKKQVSREEADTIWEKCCTDLNVSKTRGFINKLLTYCKGENTLIFPFPRSISFDKAVCIGEDYTGRDYRDERARQEFSPPENNMNITDLRDILTGYGYRCELLTDIPEYSRNVLLYDFIGNRLWSSKEISCRDDYFSALTGIRGFRGSYMLKIFW